MAVTVNMTAATLNPVVSEGMGTKDILCRIAEHDLMDEILVANKYLDYAVALDKNGGCEDICNAFCNMAHDEFHHATLQRDILLENGYTMTEEGEAAYHELKKRFEHTFR